VLTIKKECYFTSKNNRMIFKESVFNALVEEAIGVNHIMARHKINNRVWANSLAAYGRERWEELGPARRSRIMHQNKNGAHPPSVLPPQLDIELMLRKGKCAAEIMAHYHIGERLFHRILEWHGLSTLWRSTHGVRSPYRAMQHSKLKDVLRIIDPALDKILVSSTPSDGDLRKLKAAYRSLEFMLESIQDIGKRMAYRVHGLKISGMSWGRNFSELYVEEVLEAVGEHYLRNFRVGNRYVDFYLPKHNLLVEVDGCVHGPDESARDTKLKEAGFNLFVIDARSSAGLAKRSMEKLNQQTTKLLRVIQPELSVGVSPQSLP
jgi:very-short-patch-repair endonuclease